MRIPTLVTMVSLAVLGTACNAPDVSTAEKVSHSPPAELPQDHPAIEPEAAVQGSLPANHPPMDTPTDSWSAAHAAGAVPGSGPPVVVPDGVRGHWAAVHLAVTDAAGNRSEVQAALGATVGLPGGLSLRADPFLPSYMSDNAGITSRSNEPDNPAVHVALLEGDQVVEEGWVFRDWPAFNTFTGSRARVELLSADPAAGQGEAAVEGGNSL